MMRRKFTLNDFEHSLKEHADDFKMTPSKRVWYGIYNDIHPGRRWPSAAVALLLIFTLVVVGHLNTHNGIHTVISYTKSVSTKSAIIKEPEAIANNFKGKRKVSPVTTNAGAFSAGKSPILLLLSEDDNPTNKSVTKQLLSDNNVAISGDAINEGKPITDAQFLNNNTSSESKPTTKITWIEDKNSNAVNSKNDFLNTHISTDVTNILAEPQIDNTVDKNVSQENNRSQNNTSLNGTIDAKNSAKQTTSSSEKSIKELSHKKQNESLSWTYYAAPVVSGVIFKGKAVNSITANTNNITPTIGMNARKSKVLHNPAFGLDAGLQMNRKLSNKTKFTAGFELTYSGYRITSNEVHPTFATLTLKDHKTDYDYSKSYVTHYGNGNGEAIVSLRNFSWQVSLPVGFQYVMFGNDKIQFNTNANIEPSFVLKSNSFLLSSEGDNYVNDPTLIRKFNASSNIGVSISFSLGKLKWQVGPNMRYQWFSTYKSDYTIKEHLVDYGLRIAITK